MPSDFADQTLSQAALEELMSTLSLARRGNLSVRMQAKAEGVTRAVADDLNGILETQQSVNGELARVTEALAQGDLKARASVQGCDGEWDVPVQQLNAVAAQYARHCAELRRVVKSVVAGDFTRHMAVGDGSNHRGGDAQRTAEDVNGLITYLNLVVNELMQVVAAVGLDGSFSSKVQVADASGSWGLLVGSLNAMTASLSEQVHDLTETAHALHRGNLEARASVVSRGDMHALKQALNHTGERVRDLCTELVRVGDDWVEKGQVGGQVRLGEAVGDLRRAIDATNGMLEMTTHQVEQLASLSRQLAEGAAVDQSPDPEARGIFAQAQTHLLQATAQAQRIQTAIDGLATNRFPTIEGGQSEADMSLFRLGVRLKREWFGAARSGLLDARRVAESLQEFCTLSLARTAAAAGAELGALYAVEDGVVQMVVSLGAATDPEQLPSFKVGEGLVGRVASSGEALLLTEVSESNMRARTGLLEITPAAVLLYPVTYDANPVAVLEFGFVKGHPEAAQEMLAFLAQDLAEGILEAMQFEGGARTSRAAAVPDERLRAANEDLAIASARIERLTRELRTRDVSIRDLQQELDLLRDTAAADEQDGTAAGPNTATG